MFMRLLSRATRSWLLGGRRWALMPLSQPSSATRHAASVMHLDDALAATRASRFAGAVTRTRDHPAHRSRSHPAQNTPTMLSIAAGPRREKGHVLVAGGALEQAAAMSASASLWREQYDRMLRWYGRLWLGMEHVAGRSDQAPIDVFYAFAQTCSHLVDWLDHDTSQPIRRRQAEAYVAGSPALSFCADICIGAKHARLTQRGINVSSQRTVLGAFDFEDDSGQKVEKVVEAPETFINFNGQQVEAWEFALTCINEWHRLLLDEGLLSRDEDLTLPTR